MESSAAAQVRLRLEPAGPRGWFGGRTIVASEPIGVAGDVSLGTAAAALQATFDGTDTAAALTAVLAAYDGTCRVVRFGRAGSPAKAPASRDAATPMAAPAPLRAPLLEGATWDMPGAQYRAAVSETRQRIAAGDVYVLNLTARLSGTLPTSLRPESAFEVLRERAAADMAACFTGLPGGAPWIASVSPERFLRVTWGEHGSRIAEICPIKGTAPRGATLSADRDLAARLASDPKERAEHIMVVDLERNDLGTCCVPGTVHVDPLYEVVPTPYCHQLISTVRGTLRPDATFSQLLEAAFPCGSVTGAPKRAAMRIIGELESSPRGVYCGALLVAMPGELDSSVLIRTLAGGGDQAGAEAVWGAGCGITHDSDPAAEHLEMLLKASPALGDAPPPIALRETMRVARGRVPLLDLHLARLADGGAGPTTLSRVRAAIAEQLATPQAASAYARLGVTVTPDGEVAAGITDQPSSLAVAGGPVIVPVEVEEVPTLPPHGAKPAARRWWDHAHHRAESLGGHQALIVGPDGMLVDGSTATVWLLHGDTLSTPLSPPAVAGVMREVVFDRAPRHGLRTRERALTLDDYLSAQEVWLSNAVGGFVRARKG